MKNKKQTPKPVIILRPTPKPTKACKGKKGGCYWEGEPELITKLRIAA